MNQKRNLKRNLLVLMILACLGVTPAWGVPQLINYQGVLKDTNGDPVAGPVNMTFMIYGAETGGSSLWTEDHTAVPLDNGIYNVLLGSNTTLPVALFSGDNRWLEMTVNTEVFTPRTRVTSAAFNFRADNADYATTAGDAGTASSVPWTGIASRPAGLDDGDDVGITAESDPTVPASIKDGISWSEVSGIPAGLDDGDDVGLTAESDPTVPASIKDGISWSEVSSRPAGLDDGDDVGITAESDPTVPASIKDGISWSEVSSRPAGLDDGDDVGLISLDSSNYLTETIQANDIVKIKETLSIASNYTRLDYSNLRIHGGGFTGTGVEEISFGNYAVITGASFEDVMLDGNYTLFINCEFRGNIRFPMGSVIVGSWFYSVQSGTTHSIESISNSNIDNSTIERVKQVSASSISQSTLGKDFTSGTSTLVSRMINNGIYNSFIFPGSIFTGNNCRNSYITVSPKASDLVISNNNFDDLYSGEQGIILVSVTGTSWKNLLITNNNFIIQSSDPMAINLVATSSTSYQIIRVSNNNFLKGQKAISYVGNAKTVITNNVVRQTDLGVVHNGTYLHVVGNIDLD